MGSRKAITDRKGTRGRKAAAVGTSRDEVRRLVDDLPEEKLELARRYLEHLRQETGEGEVLTPEERAHLDEGLADLAAGRVVSDEEMRREFGW